MIVKIIDYFYYNNYDEEDLQYNTPVLCIKARDKERNHHLIQVCDKDKLYPRFGILAEDLQKALLNKEIWGYKRAPDSLYGEHVISVHTTFPYEVGRIKSIFDKDIVKVTQTFGADIKWEKMAMSHIISELGLEGPFIDIPTDYMFRFLKIEDIKKVEKEDFFLLKGRVCYWDIESDSRNLGSKMRYDDYAGMPIVSITTYDSYDNEYHIFVWHPWFKDKITFVEEDREIADNVIPDTDSKIKYIKRYECKTEESMLQTFFDYFGSKKFDYMFGYFSVGGWSKEKGKKVWIDGFDSQALYARSKQLGLLEDMQMMSPSPNIYGYKGRFDAVYLRTSNNKHEVVIKGVSQIDFVFAEKILAFAQKYYKFRGHKLSDWASFFLGYNKLDKQEFRVWQYWEQKDCNINDETNLELEVKNGLARIPNKGIEFMLDYNLIDVKICVDLDKRFDVTKKQVGRAEVAIAPASDGLTASKIHDHSKLTAYQDQYSFDTKYQRFKRPGINGKDQIGDKFNITLKILEEKARARGLDVTYNSLKDIHKVGGFVPIPLGRGIYEDVAVIDASKFYPNMIKSTNAGIVSAVDLDKEYWFCVTDKKGNVYDRKDIIETPVAYFRKDVKSLNALIFDKWMVERLKAQKKLQDYMDEHHTTKTDEYKLLWTEQFNIKNFMNAGFGVLGLRIDRTYSILGFNSCTMSCQDNIMLVIFILKDFGIEIIGGDTDSIFFKLITKGLKNQIKESKRICEWINRCVSWYLDKIYNIQVHTIKIGLETISDKFFVDTMKHYIKRNLYANGVILDKPELEIKGMDLKKRATAKICAELQEELIDLIFYSTNPEVEVGTFIKLFDDSLELRKWHDVCKRGPLNKDLDKYPASNETATAGRHTLKYMNRYYNPGSNPFLGVFKEYPNKMNNKFLTNPVNKDFKMLFDENDEEELKALKFKLNWSKIREMCHKKTEHLLSVFGSNYWDIVEAESMGGTCDV